MVEATVVSWRTIIALQGYFSPREFCEWSMVNRGDLMSPDLISSSEIFVISLISKIFKNKRKHKYNPNQPTSYRKTKWQSGLLERKFSVCRIRTDTFLVSKTFSGIPLRLQNCELFNEAKLFCLTNKIHLNCQVFINNADIVNSIKEWGGKFTLLKWG